MTCLVTGASGFIGGRVARQLLAAGHQVRALVRRPDRAQDLAILGARLYAGDITDKPSLRHPMSGVDCVFHLAAWYKIGARNRRDAELINVQGTRHVLEMMKELRVARGVYTSTLAVFSNTGGGIVDERYFHDGRRLGWLSEYDRTKWLAHYEVAVPMLKAGLPLIIVQPGVTYGPGDTSTIRELWRDFLRGALPMVPDKSAYCWAHVDDVARGHLLAMEKGRIGESYIIAGPAHSVFEALQIAERVSGVRAPRRLASPGMLRATAALTGLINALIPLPEKYHPETLRVAAGNTYLGSSAKAERELGFSARPLEEGLRETLEHERKLL
jgi:nucleoside-diphosphate-sugar epimerase